MDYFNNNFPQFPVVHTSAHAEYQPEITRITRLLLEALEIAFFLCNFSFKRYGLNKLCDVVNQILPTAYILNTAYWVFYSSQFGNCVCICTRFGFRCPHRRNDLHWINLTPIPEAQEKFFFNLDTGGVPHPTDINIFVEPIVNDILRAYNISTRLTIQTIFRNGNKFTPRGSSQATILIESRYLLTPEYYPLHTTLVQFQPHPTTHPNYAKYFEALKKFGERDNLFLEQVLTPRTTTIISTDKPQFNILSSPEAQPIFYPTAAPTVINWSHPFNTFYGNFNSSPMLLEQIMVNSDADTNAQYTPPPASQTKPSNNRSPKKQQSMLAHANNNSESPRRSNYYQKSKKSGVPTFRDTRHISPPSFVQSEYSYTAPSSTITPISSDLSSKGSYYFKNAQAKESPSKTPTSEHQSPHFLGYDYKKSFPPLPTPNSIAKHLSFSDVDNKVSSAEDDYENARKNNTFANSSREFGRTQGDTSYRSSLTNFGETSNSIDNFGAAQCNTLIPASNENFEKTRNNEHIGTLSETFRKVECGTPISTLTENLGTTHKHAPMTTLADSFRRIECKTPINTSVGNTSYSKAFNNFGTAHTTASNENLEKNNLPIVTLTENFKKVECSSPISTAVRTFEQAKSDSIGKFEGAECYTSISNSFGNYNRAENLSSVNDNYEGTSDLKKVINRYQVFDGITNDEYLDMVMEYIKEDEAKGFVRMEVVHSDSFDKIHEKLTADVANLE